MENSTINMVNLFFWCILAQALSSIKICIILYHFELFGRHASQGQWMWTKLVNCPESQPKWLMSNIVRKLSHIFYLKLRRALLVEILLVLIIR